VPALHVISCGFIPIRSENRVLWPFVTKCLGEHLDTRERAREQREWRTWREENVGLLILCLLLASCCFLAWVNLRLWRCRWHISPKCLLTFNVLQGIITQKIELFTESKFLSFFLSSFLLFCFTSRYIVGSRDSAVGKRLATDWATEGSEFESR
jgi:hypothetical protein